MRKDRHSIKCKYCNKILRTYVDGRPKFCNNNECSKGYWDYVKRQSKAEVLASIS